MSLTENNDNSILIQEKVFSRWISNQIRDVSKNSITDIRKDLLNGVNLIQLATNLTKKKVSQKWSNQPKHNTDMIQNCDIAFDMFEKDGVRLNGLSGKDINSNNVK